MGGDRGTTIGVGRDEDSVRHGTRGPPVITGGTLQRCVNLRKTFAGQWKRGEGGCRDWGPVVNAVVSFWGLLSHHTFHSHPNSYFGSHSPPHSGAVYLPPTHTLPPCTLPLPSHLTLVLTHASTFPLYHWQPRASPLLPFSPHLELSPSPIHPSPPLGLDHLT